MQPARLRWLWNRARCMPAAEFPHRAWRALAAHARRFGLLRAGRVPPPDLAVPVARWLRVPAGIDPRPCIAAAKRIAAGRLDVFALQDHAIHALPRWNRDPKTGTEAPLDYGPLLDYRDTARVGDIKYLWEPNRHLHLVTLAQAWAIGGEARFARVLRRHLESWFAACPYPRGPNWASALEAGLRLLNWAIAWQLVGGVRSPLFAGEGAAFLGHWLGSVYRHAGFVRAHFSRHSSANNHLIGEATGLFVASLTWPHWPAAAHWRAESLAILCEETLRQIAPDGVNREQSVAYQQAVLDLLFIAIVAGRANGIEFPAAVLARLEAACEYLACLMDAGGNLPMIGDSDDGLVVRLAPQAGFSPMHSVLASGAILFGREDFRYKARAPDDKTRWLFGSAAERWPDARALPPARRAFPEGGTYLLGTDFETPREIRVVADAGPIGYLSIAAHGHADALAFTLSVGGREYLVDPGTYAYHAEAPWRAYFRGTSAHNTVRVDGVDQSEPGGNFLWLRKAAVQVHGWHAGRQVDRLVASHDGYRRLPDPVLHRRGLMLDKRARRIVLDDELLMSGTHDVELFFHCAESCEVETVPGGFRLVQDGADVLLRVPAAEGSRVTLHRGSGDPIFGWVSRRYGVKVPAVTIAWRARLTGNQRLRSVIDC